MSFPADHWSKIHSTNGLERLNGEVKLIFDSAPSQVSDRARKIALRRGRGTTKRKIFVNQASAIWRSVGGRATPRAESARLALGRGTERSSELDPIRGTAGGWI